MLSSIAAIAAAVSALIGLGYAAVAAIKKNAAIKNATSIESITAQIKLATTPQEREQLQNALNKLINPK